MRTFFFLWTVKNLHCIFGKLRWSPDSCVLAAGEQTVLPLVRGTSSAWIFLLQNKKLGPVARQHLAGVRRSAVVLTSPVRSSSHGRSTTAVAYFVEPRQSWVAALGLDWRTGKSSSCGAPPEPAAPSGLCPAPTDSNASGICWLRRDLGPVRHPGNGWQHPHRLPCSAFWWGEEHCGVCCLHGTAGTPSLAVVSPALLAQGMYVDPAWVTDGERHFVHMYRSSIFFLGVFVYCKCNLWDEICQLAIQAWFRFW